MSKKKDLMITKKDIAKRRKEIEKEERLIKTQCCHQNHKGKLTVFPIGNKGEYKCSVCGEEFNMNPISSNELKTAINVVHNAIQQCRSFADADEEAKIIKALGETDYNLTYVLDSLYRKTINHYAKASGGKKNKKNNNRDDDFGSYGNGSFSSFGNRH